MDSSFLLAFVFQNVWKNSISGSKSRNNGIPVIKITFFLQKKIPEITGFDELTPKLLCVPAGLILHWCVEIFKIFLFIISYINSLK